jgi:hypothetical protein
LPGSGRLKRIDCDAPEQGFGAPTILGLAPSGWRSFPPTVDPESSLGDELAEQGQVFRREGALRDQ